jgi:hypothetical protein
MDRDRERDRDRDRRFVLPEKCLGSSRDTLSACLRRSTCGQPLTCQTGTTGSPIHIGHAPPGLDRLLAATRTALAALLPLVAGHPLVVARLLVAA